MRACVGGWVCVPPNTSVTHAGGAARERPVFRLCTCVDLNPPFVLDRLLTGLPTRNVHFAHAQSGALR
jgi:hypothetical protein